MNRNKFDKKRKGIKYKYYKIFRAWDNFWWIYHGNGICSPGYSSYKTFKTSNLALIIASLSLILIIILQIWN